jgi:RNA recognition motif-containing protein
MLSPYSLSTSNPIPQKSLKLRNEFRWGEIVDINMPRDKVTGKVRGFGFVMYEDQRSTVMAVDNMNGAEVVGRTLKVCLYTLI